MGHVENAVEIGADNLRPLRRRHFMEHAVAGNARIVDKDIGGAVRGFNFGDAALAGFIVAHIPFEDVDACFRLECRRRLVIARIGRRNFAALVFKR